jgi:hypothetical protein
MWTRSAFGVVVGLALGVLGSCRPAFPGELFVIEATTVRHPIMLSQVPARAAGRGFVVQSGTHKATTSAGNTTYREWGQSTVPASTQLAAQLQSADGWVQIDGAEFAARDLLSPFYTSSDRMLTIAGTVHR